jgi:hypothetical protein
MLNQPVRLGETLGKKGLILDGMLGLEVEGRVVGRLAAGRVVGRLDAGRVLLWSGLGVAPQVLVE